MPLYALAAKLSYSRLYLGVHYPSDVLAGALLGTAVAAMREHGGASGTQPLRAPQPREAAQNGHTPQAFATPTGGGPA